MVKTHPLRAYRKKAGLSQEELAETLCVGKSAVSKWEAGTRSPRPNVMVRIGSITGGAVTANDFFEPQEAAE